MELLAVFVSLCLVSPVLVLHRPVEAVPVHKFVEYGAERNRGVDYSVRYGDELAVDKLDKYGDEDNAVDDYNIVGYLNRGNVGYGPFEVTHEQSEVPYEPSDVQYGWAEEAATYNVVDYGARGNGGDDSQAFAEAWQAVCQDGGSRGPPTFYLPSRKMFMLSPTVFPGPCKSESIKVQIDVALVAPRTMSGWESCPLYSWLLFSDVSNLNVYGSGTIDGQGSIWWQKSHAQMPLGYQITGCSETPTALKFHNCENLTLSGLRHLNSPRNHLSINMCTNVTISYLQLLAPETSPNTDGIDISASTDIKIHDLSIETGDDCIAINANTTRVIITNVKCGPGHGISVGSLGAHGSAAFVKDIHVRHCTFIGSQNGARIKTWQGGSGVVRNIIFEDITLVRAKNPIIIDQFYCNGRKDCGTSPRNLKISNVTYNRVRGTSASKDAVKFNCAITGCTGIVMNQVNIMPAVPNEPVTTVCRNAELFCDESTSPKVYC